MTLANQITIIRIILIPALIISMLMGNRVWPVIIFTFTVISDSLDGFVARWRKEQTPLGSFLDPMADKLLMFSCFLTLAYLKVLPLWIFVIMLSRDILIVLGWGIIYLLTESTEIKPRLLGKLTTIFQMLTIWLILLGIPTPLSNKLLIATVIITIISGLDYVLNGSRKLSSHS